MTDIGWFCLAAVVIALPFFVRRMLAARDERSREETLAAASPLFVLSSLAALGPNHEAWRYALSIAFLLCAAYLVAIRWRLGRQA